MNYHQQQPVVHVHQHVQQRDTTVAYLLWFFLGFYGAHKFYLGEVGMGVLYIFTGGLCGIGWLIDAFTMPGVVDRFNQKARYDAQMRGQAQNMPRYY